MRQELLYQREERARKTMKLLNNIAYSVRRDSESLAEVSNLYTTLRDDAIRSGFNVEGLPRNLNSALKIKRIKTPEEKEAHRIRSQAEVSRRIIECVEKYYDERERKYLEIDEKNKEVDEAIKAGRFTEALELLMESITELSEMREEVLAVQGGVR